MPLLYNLVSKSNPRRINDPKKLYISLRNFSLMKQDEMCERIAEKLGLHRDTCRSVLNCWNDESIKVLVNGQAVELGDGGYVYLTASSMGADDEESATLDLLKNIKGHIRFSDKAKAAFNKATLVPAVTMLSGIHQLPEEGNNP